MAVHSILYLLKDLIINDNQKHHFELESKEIQAITTSTIKIKDCRIQYMIVFFPDGSIQVKQNICSCKSCTRDALIHCSFEPAVQVNSREINSSDDKHDKQLMADENIQNLSANILQQYAKGYMTGTNTML